MAAIFLGVAAVSASDREEVGVLTGKDFKNIVEKSKVPVFVDIWATWCGPCRAYGPIVDGAAKKYRGKIAFYRMDASNGVNREIIQKFQVDAIPTTLLFVNGKLVDRWVGLVPKNEVNSGLKKLLALYGPSSQNH
jgi:thioredoxin 1